MAQYIGPNGPIPIPPGAFDYTDLRTRLDAALPGSDEGRYDRVQAALQAAKVPPGVIPPLWISLDASPASIWTLSADPNSVISLGA
jgi:hypothetical protein